jgi:uncharacterized membrane protein
MSYLNGFLLIIGLFWGWQAISVNISLAWIYLIVLVVFVGVKSVQHYNNETEYRVEKNKFLYLETAAVLAITGLSILMTGKLLLA